MINLYSWSEKKNFGDAVSKPIVEWISGSEVNLVDKAEKGKLLAVGSVLQYAQDGDIVWGTGIHPTALNNFSRENQPGDITVLAVRGPITRDALLARGVACPLRYGDPAILLPKFYTPPGPANSGSV